LAENFKNPPDEFSILPLWSWNGALNPEKLKWQIDQMVDKGINGAFMHARAGLDESETAYFSEGFWNAVNTSIRYSYSKGFHAYLYDEDKWPSGSAGGRTVAANPEELVKKMLNFRKWRWLVRNHFPYKRQSDYFSTMGQLQVPGADNEEYRYGFAMLGVYGINMFGVGKIGNFCSPG
jgi:hypothetical protein